MVKNKQALPPTMNATPPNNVDLRIACPVYKVMALAPKVFKVGEFHDVVDISIRIVTHKKNYLHRSGDQQYILL